MGAGATATETTGNLDREHLVAWCIVPFDARKRGPAERAQMLVELGIRRCAYDWRNEHIPQFEEEILEYKKHGIAFFAFWGGHEDAFRLFEKHALHPQIWQMLGSPSEGTQTEKVEAATSSLLGVARRTAELGCKLALYNHGGWGGEPVNLVAVCERLHALGHPHVGIVYNWHHGHGHIDDWKESLALMKPFLHCLNLNGMNAEGEPKILTLAQGAHELEMLETVRASGYDGPIGILDHQEQLDSKEALQDNIDGLEWLKKELSLPGSAGARPTPKAMPVSASATNVLPPGPSSVESLREAFGTALAGGLLLEGKPQWRDPPITVECRARLQDANGYNILIASDTKASSTHWELFSMTGSGHLTAYLPGAVPDHIASRKVITDGSWHAIAMQYAADRVRLWVDGEIVADQPIALKSDRRIVEGGIAFGRLVEGPFVARGAIDEVRIREDIHEDIANGDATPLEPGAEGELGRWDFNDLAEPASAAPFSREPLDPASFPHWNAPINRDRVYDFYAKQALRFGPTNHRHPPAFPGLDGGAFGHWGNQNDEDTWRDARIREMDHGSMVSGVFRGAGRTHPRGVSIDLGDGFNVVFDQDSLSFTTAWKGALVRWSDVRRGFMHGTPMGDSETVPISNEARPTAGSRYLGLYRVGNRVVIACEKNGKKRYLAAAVRHGSVVVSEESKPRPSAPQWPDRVVTRGTLGEGSPYAVDTLTLPDENPWRALFFLGGLDFSSARRIAICTIHGDVWICDVLKEDLSELSWKRFAAGLHQPLGLVVVDGLIHVRCRDQIVALHDSNGDDEAEFYECVSEIHATSAGGHDFITGLQRDDQGRWYFASGNQGVCRVSPDGDHLEVVATGLRNPNGLGISPDGSVILTGVQEGNWTPASAVCDVSQGGHFGAGGPLPAGRGYVPPMLYLPRGADNSSGGQAYISSSRWGPVTGQWVHFSSGFATSFLVLREVIDGQSQAAAIPLPVEYLSGAHRGRFSPFDGQLYVAGAQGWGNYGVNDGSLQRVRFTADSYPYPIRWESHDNGILLTFSEPASPELTDPRKWFAQHWNYRYGPGYGSPELSVSHPDQEGHDRLEIRSVQRLGNGERLFVEIPQIHPVHQLHLYFMGSRPIETFATLHRLGTPFTDFPGYGAIPKTPLAGTSPDASNDFNPTALVQACAACHHPSQHVIGPSMAEIRQRYENNPDGIVRWAMNPENRNPALPPMPSFQSLGEAKLKIIAEHILSMPVREQ